MVATIKSLRERHIRATLAACDDNVSETARRLGLHRRTLQRQLRAMNGGEPIHLPVLACSVSALRSVEAERNRRDLASRAIALDAILEEWRAARLGRDIS
jgi:AraC-like DNA-binding protein